MQKHMIKCMSQQQCHLIPSDTDIKNLSMTKLYKNYKTYFNQQKKIQKEPKTD